MNNTDGKTGVLGLIGKPVEHTLSPIIQNMLAEEYDRNVIRIIPCPARPEYVSTTRP